MRRKVVTSECVHGYTGHPSTVMTCEACGKMGATRGPCPFASEIRDDFRPVNLCGECRKYREKDLQRMLDAQ